MRFTVLTALFAFLSTVSASPVHVEAESAILKRWPPSIQESTGAHFSKRNGNGLDVFSPFLMKKWDDLKRGLSTAKLTGQMGVTRGHLKSCAYTREDAIKQLKQGHFARDDIDVFAIERSNCRIYYVWWLQATYGWVTSDGYLGGHLPSLSRRRWESSMQESAGAHFSKRTGNDLDIFDQFLMRKWNELGKEPPPAVATLTGHMTTFPADPKPCTYTKEDAIKYLKGHLKTDNHHDLDVFAIERRTCQIHYISWWARVNEYEVTSSSKSGGEPQAGTNHGSRAGRQ